MSNIPALGARSQPASLTTANRQNDGKTTGAGALKKTGIADTPISLSSDALDMQKRVASVGNATVDFAQDFVSSFTQALFGDAAKGATIDFDSASLDASSSYALGVQHTEGPNGSSDAAAFKLSDSSHFIGKGTITTADGRKFDFEVEVQYNYDLSAAASQTQTGNQPVADDSTDKPAAGTKDLPTVQVPNIDFPGTLSDLFKLIGRDLQTALSNGDKSDSKTGDGIDRNTLRSLSLRLLNLVDSKDTNTYAPPVSADKAKSATNAYDAQSADAQAAPQSVAAPAPAPAPVADPAPAAAAAAATGDDGKSPTAASS
jgi:hypothetical protein